MGSNRSKLKKYNVVDLFCGAGGLRVCLSQHEEACLALLALGTLHRVDDLRIHTFQHQPQPSTHGPVAGSDHLEPDPPPDRTIAFAPTNPSHSPITMLSRTASVTDLLVPHCLVTFSHKT